MIDSQQNSGLTKSNEPLQISIIQQTQEYILGLFNQDYDTRMLYHNYKRTNAIASVIDELTNDNVLDAETIEVAKLAAWLHCIGYMYDYDNAPAKSLSLAKDFLVSKAYPTDKLNKVLGCINATKPNVQPKTVAEQLLSDAINSQNSATDFFDDRPLLRLEWELMQNRQKAQVEWDQLQLQHLFNTRFYTSTAKLNYESAVAQNIIAQKARLEKSKLNELPIVDEEDGGIRKFQNLERKVPRSALQTFFRANYRNHINLSIIADNKANIMISVNAILISVVISILSYRNLTESNPMVLLPIVIFLVTGLASLISAVLSIRPKITTLNKDNVSTEVVKKNIIFFGNFVHLTVEQFEEAMDAMFRDGELIYGNMTRDLYYLGKVLDKKYHFLTISYNIFMVGFISTVFTFLFVVFS